MQKSFVARCPKIHINLNDQLLYNSYFPTYFALKIFKVKHDSNFSKKKQVEVKYLVKEYRVKHFIL